MAMDVSRPHWKLYKKEVPPCDGLHTEYLVSVMSDTWRGPKTMVAEWDGTQTKKKNQTRWKWHDAVFPACWDIIAWAQLPPPCEDGTS